MKTLCKARKWGNSLGFTIPKEIVDQQRIKPEDELFITIEKKRHSLFGIWKEDRSSPEEVRKWLDEEHRKEKEDDEKLWRMVTTKGK